MEGRDLPRSMTLSEQMTGGDSSDHGGDGPTPEPGSDGAAGRVGGGRTLLDIIRQEQEAHGGVLMDGSSGINWKAFKERILLRRAGNAWSDATAASPSVQRSPISDPELRVPVRPNPFFARSISRSASVLNRERPGFQSAYGRGAFRAESAVFSATEVAPEEPSAGGEASDDAENAADAVAPAAEEAVEEEQPMKMSLMSLLEQTDSQWTDSPHQEDEDEEEDGDNDGDGDNGGCGGAEMVYVCCVCMVRHKGAAFIPCGHTFCRLCSRELWVSRGNCPLCNGYILEILDIF